MLSPCLRVGGDTRRGLISIPGKNSHNDSAAFSIQALLPTQGYRPTAMAKRPSFSINRHQVGKAGLFQLPIERG